MNLKRLLLLTLILFSYQISAKNHIVSLTITKTGEKVQVLPRLRFKTSKDIKEAIDNGIRINLIVKTQVYAANSFWFDNTIANKKISLEVSYFTLSELYMVKNLASGEQQAFNNYEQLWKDIEKLITLNFKNIPQKPLWIKMRIMLDKAALPTAMQLPVLFNSNWDINTPWYKQKMESL